MRVLVACEFSGVVREAFRARGHDAWSCDIIPSEDDSKYHLLGDALSLAYVGSWDLMIAHPPCTYIALCQIWRKYKPGQEWRKFEEEKAIGFFRALHCAPIERICIENPKSVASTRVSPKTQTVQPWQFGHPEQKETWLWLKNLDPLLPTNNVKEYMMTLPRKEREREYTSLHLEKTEGRTAVELTQELRRRWRHNGAR